MYLVWLFYDKFDELLTPDERERRDYAEHTVFKYNVGFKALSLLTLTYTVFRRRPKPNYLLDFMLLYSGAYCFLLSYIVGVYKVWPLYENSVKKMVRSRKRINIDKDNTLLDDIKIKYYKYDIAFCRFF